MKTGLTVITTAILTAIAFLFLGQQGMLAGLLPSPSCNDGLCRISETGATCMSPWGDIIMHGKTVISYAEPDGNCSPTLSTCIDGAWENGATPQPYNLCTSNGENCENLENMPLPCEVNGFYVGHDQTEIFYAQGELVNGQRTCPSQQRTCDNGKLDGSNQYRYLGCAAECWPAEEVIIEEEEEPEVEAVITQPAAVYEPSGPARCSSPWGGTAWEHGKQATAYLQSAVGFGQACQPISIVCGYGTIRYGTAGAIGEPVGQTVYASCGQRDPIGCTSACGDVAHGSSVTTYSQALIPHGNGTTCNDIRIVSTCTDGTLSPNAGSACSCEIAPPAPCTAPNGQTVADGASLTLYEYPQVQALPGDGSDTCVRQWRQCINGTWHDRNGAASAFTFQYATCEVIPPPEGGGPGGEGVPTE